MSAAPSFMINADMTPESSDTRVRRLSGVTVPHINTPTNKSTIPFASRMPKIIIRPRRSISVEPSMQAKASGALKTPTITINAAPIIALVGRPIGRHSQRLLKMRSQTQRKIKRLTHVCQSSYPYPASVGEGRAGSSPVIQAL
mmetsp:Transcript_41744/g.67793  ORF Transcript_41744/g.67793 Transcript_41744/m.67793 type:complete len:143 (+) Transcript_41744:1668-2096(+)